MNTSNPNFNINPTPGSIPGSWQQPENHEYWEKRPKNDIRRDWNYRSNHWISGYMKSQFHPHRLLIKQVICDLLPIKNILELGCNCGPNLAMIAKEFPAQRIELNGIDINKDAIEYGKERLDANFCVGRIDELLLFPSRSMDIVLTDAVLLYVGSDKINQTMDEICRVTNKAVILVEWFDESKEGILKDFHWARNYPLLLKERGFETVSYKITKQSWPSKNWSNNGYVFVGRRLEKVEELLPVKKTLAYA